MTDFTTDVLTFANRVAPGASAGIAKMFGKDVGGVSSLVVQSSDGVEHQLAPSGLASPGGVSYSALTNVMTTASGNSLADNTSAQNIFTASRDTITLTAGYYRVRSYISTSRTGTAAGTISVSFAGTATYGSVGLRAYGRNSVSLTASVPIGLITSAAGGVAVISSSNTSRTFWLDGSLIITADGTVIPQMTFSVAPGSLVFIGAESFMELVRVGPAAFTQQGGWT